MCRQRGHSKDHMQRYIVRGKSGNRIRRSCDFIMGTLGVESAGFRAVLCGDYPDRLPEGMLSV